MINQMQLRTLKKTDMGPKRKGAIRYTRNLRIVIVIYRIYGMVYLNDKKKLSCKKGAFGS